MARIIRDDIFVTRSKVRRTARGSLMSNRTRARVWSLQVREPDGGSIGFMFREAVLVARSIDGVVRDTDSDSSRLR
jgi:hypothetical protein